MKNTTLTIGLILIAGTALSATPTPVPLAVLDFQTPDQDTGHTGKDAAALLNAKLSQSPDLILVERQELEKILGEQELGLSGDVTPESAAKVGDLTGAKVLITGRIFDSGDKSFLVLKIMGTETGRVYGESVSFPDINHLDAAIADLAPKVEDVLSKRADTLVAPPEDPTAHLDLLKRMIAGKKLPTVSVRISEQQIESIVIDPAAETEMKLVLQQLGFKVIETKDSNETPDVTISGEAFSEYGGRTGNLVSGRARVEVKVSQTASGKLLLADRQTDMAADMAEAVAGKTALQNAAEKLMDRIIPKLVAD